MGCGCLVSSGNSSYIPDKVSDLPHTLFQTMTIKYMLKLNNKIKDEVSRQNKMGCVYFIFILYKIHILLHISLRWVKGEIILDQLVCLQLCFIGWRWRLCSRALVLFSCPSCTLRQCFGLGPRTKPEAHRSAPASPERRLSLTLHQLYRHSRFCVRVCRCSFQLVAVRRNKVVCRSSLVVIPKLWRIITRSRNCPSGRKDRYPWLCASYMEWKTWWHRAASWSGAWHIRPWGRGTIAGWCHADASSKPGSGLENATRYDSSFSTGSRNDLREKEQRFYWML